MKHERVTHESSNGRTAGLCVTSRWMFEVMSCEQLPLCTFHSSYTFLSCHSMSLHLGNEVFDVYKAPLQGDHNHLFIRQGTGLQGQAVFKTKLTFR